MRKVKLFSDTRSFITWNYLQNFMFTLIYLMNYALIPQTNAIESYAIVSKMYVYYIVSN
jgi:hypothetical protein